MQVLFSLKTKKTSTITFRIDHEYEKGLRKEAEANRISLNTLANQVFGDHVEFNQLMKKFGMVEMSKGSFQQILNLLDENSIANLAISIGSKEAKDFILFKWRKMSSESVSEFIKMYFEHCGYGMCDIQRNENNNEISVHHNFGKKGSIFLKAFLEAIFQSTLDEEVKATTTENSVTLSYSN